MRPEDIQFVPRPRPAPEAVDLGCVLVRQWWPSLQFAWLSLALPVAVALLLSPLSIGWKLGLFWWLKPLYEIAPLYLLSRRVFGENPGLRHVLRAWPGLVRRYGVALLTWRRLNPYRSFDMPVAVLEGQRGAGYRARLQVLHREDTGAAFWLMCIAANAEWLIAAALGIVLEMMVPQAVFGDITMRMLFGSDPFIFLVTLAGITLVAPFYVGCGFALYLNRRTNLEAWDLELLFRRIAARLARGLVMLLVGVLLVGAVMAPPAYAAPDAPTPATMKKDVEAVLAGPDFHDRITIKSPVWSMHRREQRSSHYDLNLLSALWAKRIEYGIWIIALAILVLLLLRYRHWRLRLPEAERRRARDAAQLPTFLDNTGDASPGQSAEDRLRDLWRHGNQREAVGALYRQFLLLLIEQRGLVCRAGDTEKDCLHRARDQGMTHVDYLAELTQSWLQVAYAHRPLPDTAFDRLWAVWSDIERELAVPEAAP